MPPCISLLPLSAIHKRFFKFPIELYDTICMVHFLGPFHVLLGFLPPLAQVRKVSIPLVNRKALVILPDAVEALIPSAKAFHRIQGLARRHGLHSLRSS